MLTKKQLDTLKRILEEEKQAIKRQMNLNSKYSNRNTSMRETVDELSAYDNHPADLGTELFEREREFALEEHQDKELEKVNFALSAIRKGIYGKCQVCGEEIPFERLEVLPSTLHCVNHSQETSDRNYRPVREELLEPPMVYSFRHNLVDTQDSYEEVAKFGTSETPSDFVGDYNSYNDLYFKGKIEELYAEDYESYSATDITGQQKYVLPSRKLEEYKELLQRNGIESKIGDIPYKKRDSYIDDKKTESE
ncbi:TraR/DksA C4-type zinc finger protein [Neobacillus cucumis]|uniref:TraR/DksA C4-type zinc finger protein n=1 Tax=Neobacillus cucumis TaxID=1740721 RepID=UPI0028530FDB|nr:TraR/DksA C4-type zinc finger protein [Neobacillus cucumis]MDR4946003.1 TraR/DksA C4-type zinc finger protein [Neobacillus cucumis]